MEKPEEEKQVKETHLLKKRILAIIIIFVIISATAIILWKIFSSKGDENVSIGYESGAVTVTDQDELQKMIDGMIQKTKDGTMSLEYKNVAVSNNGRDFSCYIANSIKNKYDMFFGIYKDATLKDELYLTELIPPGSGMKNIQLKKQLKSGTHNVVLVFTQVREDHKTIKSQISVQLTLSVK